MKKCVMSKADCHDPWMGLDGKRECDLCSRGKINWIFGCNITSRYATYDLGRFTPKFCPECGKRL